jgi:hypothetical protein
MQAGIPQRIYYLIVDGLESLLAQRRALGLQQLNEEEETIKAFVLPLERRVVKLQQFCNAELERNDILQARCKREQRIQLQIQELF